jgi:hypothetical protein
MYNQPTMRRLLFTLCWRSSASPAQSAAVPASDPLAPLNFLLGTWTAARARYRKRRSPGPRHLHLQPRPRRPCPAAHRHRRHMQGPAGLRLQPPRPAHHLPRPQWQAIHGSSLFALYLDNEGHVIYYTIATPDAHTAVFNSQGPAVRPKVPPHLPPRRHRPQGCHDRQVPIRRARQRRLPLLPGVVRHETVADAAY